MWHFAAWPHFEVQTFRSLEYLRTSTVLYVKVIIVSRDIRVEPGSNSPLKDVEAHEHRENDKCKFCGRLAYVHRSPRERQRGVSNCSKRREHFHGEKASE